MHAKRPSTRGGRGQQGPTQTGPKPKKPSTRSNDEQDDILSKNRRRSSASTADEDGEETLADEDEDLDDDFAQDEDLEGDGEGEEVEGEDDGEVLGVNEGDGGAYEDLSVNDAMKLFRDERQNPRLGVSEALTEAELRDISERKEAEAAALRPTIPDGALATINRQGYQVFKMDGVDFFVAEGSQEGHLVLSNTYYYDNLISMYARPKVVGALPSSSRQLQIIPWIESRSPDTLKNKPGMSKMKKVYMLGVESTMPKYKVAMEELYCFEAATKILSKCEVRTIGRPRDPVLRIRKDGITIEDSLEAPNPSLVSLGHDEMHETFARPSESKSTDIEMTASSAAVMTVEALEAMEAEKLAKIEELEQQAEQMDELDEAPDVPDSDMTD